MIFTISFHNFKKIYTFCAGYTNSMSIFFPRLRRGKNMILSGLMFCAGYTKHPLQIVKIADFMTQAHFAAFFRERRGKSHLTKNVK